MSDITFDTCTCGSVVVFSAQSVTDEFDRLRALNAELEGALRDLVRLIDEDQEEDVPPYLADQVIDRARAAIAKAKEGE